MSAWLFGFIGVVLTYIVGTVKLGLSPADAAICVLSSNIAGICALLFYSWAMRSSTIRRRIMVTPASTWAVFLTVYFGTELALAAPLRDSYAFGWLALPTIFSTGFCVLAYGPIQDKIVSRSR